MERKKLKNNVLIENLLHNMTFLEQYVARVINYTSRYNNHNIYMYAPVNLVGKCMKYPSYGDFPDAYCLRTYGKWWRTSESCQSNYTPQNFDPYGAQDYITMEFGSAVIPRDICIYEIYNPGGIVRIWGKKMKAKFPWVLLWEGPPQKCINESRKFCPNIRKVNCLIYALRIEFNQDHLEYHQSIDAVLLGGLQPATTLQFGMIVNNLVDNFIKSDESEAKVANSSEIAATSDVFSNLPYEVFLHILQYMDLKSLNRCAQVNKYWNYATSDTVLYQSVSLKMYWNLVNCDTLEYFINKGDHVLRKLDLSWCGIEIEGFSERVCLLLNANEKSLTHLSLCECNVDDNMIQAISRCTQLIDLRLKNTTNWTNSTLDNLNKLISLDLSGTNIQDADLIKLLKSNRKLKYLILDLCESLTNLNQVIEVAAAYTTNLTTWSSWKTPSLSYEGARSFGRFGNLKELDLGWCLINTDPGDALEHIARGCPLLNKLIISEWRGANDSLLFPIITNCKELVQLDLMGMKNVSSELCEKALVLLPKLRRLEISFCDSINPDEVDIWRQQYPHITIQRSCEFVVTEYFN